MNHTLKSKLVTRLRNALSPGRNLDAQATKSILIDVRDLLELLGETERYKVLKFHCDWILHPKVTGPRVQKIIKAVDIECAKSLEKLALLDWSDRSSTFFGPIGQDFIDDLQGRFTFYAFETELTAFLQRHHIADLPDPQSPFWRGFELVYCQLIEDRTWEYTNKKDPTLYVNRVQVRMQKRPESADADLPPDCRAFPFYLHWGFFWGNELK